MVFVATCTTRALGMSEEQRIPGQTSDLITELRVAASEVTPATMLHVILVSAEVRCKPRL